jgi:hypothetical protein
MPLTTESRKTYTEAVVREGELDKVADDDRGSPHLEVKERPMEMKLELVPVPVIDIDRAKAFYVDRSGLSRTSMFGQLRRCGSSS